MSFTIEYEFVMNLKWIAQHTNKFSESGYKKVL